jgi:DivIVA domain-containing protein
VDWKDIDRIRVPGFTLARRGYDKHEVDRFLARLADWLETDAPNEIGDMAVARKLELVGKSTSHILMTTEQQASELRKSSEEECAQMIAEAEAAAQQTRAAADEYAKQTRAKADEYAKQTRAKADADAQANAAAASAQARDTIEEGERRRAQIESVIADLEVRRDDALADLDALRKELGATITSHRPAARSNGRSEERVAKEQAAKQSAAKA